MNQYVPLVFSNKISPSPWNGGSFSHSTITTGGSGGQSNVFFYICSDGSSTARDYDGGLFPGGTWTTTPGTSYEVSSTITSSSIPPGCSASSTGGVYTPVIFGGGLGTDIGGVTAIVDPGGLGVNASATYSISIRKVGTTTPVVTSTLSLFASVTNDT